ncbi:MAG: LysM peptidoglycan-binding domain-containing protein [Tannerellaceae bacterium]|jgi:LysM repeat protein|nr:LysM peptidoglycan-binding domain-containing protein [Tannerellaceae bacterium]
MNNITIYILAVLLSFAGVILPLHSQERETKNVTTNPQGDDIFLHTIEAGQTVYAIATMYGVGVEDIYRLNPGSREVIKTGQKLRIPQKEVATTVTAPKEEMDYSFHTIQAKETLYSLSKRYQVSAEKIIEANPGLSVATFQIGKTIRIPSATATSIPKTEIQTVVKEIEYKIERRETMYRLTRKFNVTPEELLEKNPQLKNGVKAGMIIKIPVRTDEAVSEKVSELKERDVNALLATPVQMNKVDRIKVALLLPFMADQIGQTSTTSRFTEYYEGLLLAIDSLKSAGVSVDLMVRDVGATGTQRLNQVLNEPALKNVHLIIGALESEQIKPIADFAQQHSIRYVIPFTSKNDDVLSNYYVYQVNTPHSYLYVNASKAAYDMFCNYNIIFVDTYDKDDKAEFIKTFKLELTQKKVVFRDLVYHPESFSNDVLALMVPNKKNVIIPISGSLAALNKIRSPLRTVVEANPQFAVNMFGYPEWQTFTRESLDDFFFLDTYIYSHFYADNMANNVSRFNLKYKTWFSKEMLNTFPKYGILGFDTGMFFLEAIHQYGTNFEHHLDKMKYKSIQTGFDFQRVNNWGGFINTNIFIVHYNKQDYNVIRHEIKK